MKNSGNTKLGTDKLTLGDGLKLHSEQGFGVNCSYDYPLNH